MRSVLCRLVKISLTLLIVSGCAGQKVYLAHPLVDQIITPRPGHEGKLTNRTCGKYEKGICTDERITDYEISDASFRETVNKLSFICNIGGRRFKVCLDKPGFCRFSTETYRCGFLKLSKCTKRLEEYLPAEPYKFLLDSKLRCFNKETYPFGGIQ